MNYKLNFIVTMSLLSSILMASAPALPLDPQLQRLLAEVALMPELQPALQAQADAQQALVGLHGATTDEIASKVASNTAIGTRISQERAAYNTKIGPHDWRTPAHFHATYVTTSEYRNLEATIKTFVAKKEWHNIAPFDYEMDFKGYCTVVHNTRCMCEDLMKRNTIMGHQNAKLLIGDEGERLAINLIQFVTYVEQLRKKLAATEDELDAVRLKYSADLLVQQKQLEHWKELSNTMQAATVAMMEQKMQLALERLAAQDLQKFQQLEEKLTGKEQECQRLTGLLEKLAPKEPTRAPYIERAKSESPLSFTSRSVSPLERGGKSISPAATQLILDGMLEMQENLKSQIRRLQEAQTDMAGDVSFLVEAGFPEQI